MGVSFFETMQGTLTDESGVSRRIVLDLRCVAPRVRSWFQSGHTAVTGTVNAEPWARAVACEGALRITPRKLTYVITFHDDTGRLCRLVGHKYPNPIRPIVSMTEMDVKLWREDQAAAQGSMYFAVADLLRFVRSWRLAPTGNYRAIGQTPGRFDSADGLSPSEGRTLAAVAVATISPGRAVPAFDSESVQLTSAWVSRLPWAVHMMVKQTLRALNTLALGRHGRPFASLSTQKQRQLLALASRFAAGDALLQVVTTPIKLAHFQREDYRTAIGMPGPRTPPAGPLPRHVAATITPNDLPSDSVIEADVVVVGTGAGGAPLAAVLAERGHAVALVEAGQYFHRGDFSTDPVQRSLRMYWDSGATLALGNPPILIPSGRTVGGSTTVNSGVALRTPDAVLEQWVAGGLPTDFAPASFARHLDTVERALGVAPADDRYLGQIAQVVARGASTMGLTHGVLPRNAVGCDGQGECAMGCPTGAKNSADVTWVPRALRAGAGLYSQMTVEQIVLNRQKAVGVVAYGYNHSGARRRIEIRARIVVLAAGALATPALLVRNGICSPALGRNLSIQPALGFMVKLPQDGTRPWSAIPMSYGVRSRADSLVTHEGFYLPPGLAAAGLPMIGSALADWMDDWGRVAQFGFMVRDSGPGTVTAAASGRPRIHYRITPRVLRALQSGAAELTEILLCGGATDVHTRIRGVDVLSTIAAARGLRTTRLSAKQFRPVAFHPMGTARMGTDPRVAVVDSTHRVFGHEGLYVVDASVLPTSLGVNPQVTIMAMALRAADVLDEQLNDFTT